MCRLDPAIASLNYTLEKCRRLVLSRTSEEFVIRGWKRGSEYTATFGICASLAMVLCNARNRFSGKVILDSGEDAAVYARGATEATRQLLQISRIWDESLMFIPCIKGAVEGFAFFTLRPHRSASFGHFLLTDVIRKERVSWSISADETLIFMLSDDFVYSYFYNRFGNALVGPQAFHENTSLVWHYH